MRDAPQDAKFIVMHALNYEIVHHFINVGSTGSTVLFAQITLSSQTLAISVADQTPVHRYTATMVRVKQVHRRSTAHITGIPPVQRDPRGDTGIVFSDSESEDSDSEGSELGGHHRSRSNSRRPARNRPPRGSLAESKDSTVDDDAAPAAPVVSHNASRVHVYDGFGNRHIVTGATKFQLGDECQACVGGGGDDDDDDYSNEEIKLRSAHYFYVGMWVLDGSDVSDGSDVFAATVYFRDIEHLRGFMSQADYERLLAVNC